MPVTSPNAELILSPLTFSNELAIKLSCGGQVHNHDYSSFYSATNQKVNNQKYSIVALLKITFLDFARYR